MATFLELCQNTARECGVTESADIPSAVTGQTGELLRVINWVIRANERIGNGRNWRWLRREFTLTTTAGDDTYAYTDCTDTTDSAAISRFKSWRVNDRLNPVQVYLQSSGVGSEIFVDYVEYDQFYRLWKFNANQNETGIPRHITVDPANNILLGPTPDAVYVVTGSYNRSAQTLAADADEPDMPSMYHDIIMYEAMREYSLYESAPEVFERVRIQYDRLMRQLQQNQKEPLRTARPLA